jgi:hypothetical protein
LGTSGGADPGAFPGKYWYFRQGAIFHSYIFPLSPAHGERKGEICVSATGDDDEDDGNDGSIDKYDTGWRWVHSRA